MEKRRDFLGYSFATIATVGVGFSLIGMKKAWDPLPSVLKSGFTKVNLKQLQIGIPFTTMWRGKPIFILRKSSLMKDSPRDVIINNKRYIIVIGLCTHLGCIPAWKKDKWQCACHGGIFNYNGVNVFGPPPRPLDFLPFKVEGDNLILGEKGKEYKKLLALNNQ